MTSAYTVSRLTRLLALLPGKTPTEYLRKELCVNALARRFAWFPHGMPPLLAQRLSLELLAARPPRFRTWAYACQRKGAGIAVSRGASATGRGACRRKAGIAKVREALVGNPGAPGLREKLTKLGAKVATHSRYVIFQMAEVEVPRDLFARILERDQWFGVPPPLPGGI